MNTMNDTQGVLSHAERCSLCLEETDWTWHWACWGFSSWIHCSKRNGQPPCLFCVRPAVVVRGCRCQCSASRFATSTQSVCAWLKFCLIIFVHNMISHQLATHWFLMNWWLLSGVKWFIQQQQHYEQCLVTLNVFLVRWSFCPTWIHLQPSPLQYLVFEVLIGDRCLSWLGFGYVMPLVFLNSVASADVNGSMLYYSQCALLHVFRDAIEVLFLHLEGWRF